MYEKYFGFLLAETLKHWADCEWIRCGSNCNIIVYDLHHWGKTCDNNLHRVVMLTLAEKALISNRSNLPLIPPNIYCTKDLIWFNAMMQLNVIWWGFANTNYFRNIFAPLPPPSPFLWFDCIFVYLIHVYGV